MNQPTLSAFPPSLRCRHFLVPEWCDLCLTAVSERRTVEEHVRVRILARAGQTFAKRLARRAEKSERAKMKPVRRARRRLSPRSGDLWKAAPARRDVISPVLGKTFDLPIRTAPAPAAPSKK